MLNSFACLEVSPKGGFFVGKKNMELLFGSIATSLAMALLSFSPVPIDISAHSLILTEELSSLREFRAVASLDKEPTITQDEIIAAEYVKPPEAPKSVSNLIPKQPSHATNGSGFLGAPQYVVDIATSASKSSGMPLNLILAQLKKESGFNPKAVSRTSDYGIAQIHMPKIGVTIDQAFDPYFAIPWQANVMSGYFRSYGNWRTALAAYNAGSAGMSRGLGFSYADTVLRLAGI